MCGAPEISTIVLMMGAILVLSLSGMSMNSLARRLEMFHPAEWERFKKPAYMRYFESIHDQRFEWYVLAGRYSALRDAGVTHAGNRARLLGILEPIRHLIRPLDLAADVGRRAGHGNHRQEHAAQDFLP
jgi:hypothetical protein